VVFPVPDERLGQAVAAALVPCDGWHIDEATLRRFVAERLAPAKVPRRIVVVAAIPTGPNGKIRRRSLAELLGVAPSAPSWPDRPRGRLPEGPLETAVAEAWAAVLGIEDLGADEEFLALGGDSLQAARIVARLRDALRFDLSVALFFEAGTVTAMAGVLDGMLLHQADKSVPVAAQAGFDPAARLRGPIDEVGGGE
jgi:acyl carrier protein